MFIILVQVVLHLSQFSKFGEVSSQYSEGKQLPNIPFSPLPNIIWKQKITLLF